MLTGWFDLAGNKVSGYKTFITHCFLSAMYRSRARAGKGVKRAVTF